jgi:hypothetical protein
MDSFFLAAAGLGGALLACQFLAGLLGFGGHHDTGHDHDASGDHDHEAAHHASSSTWFFSLLTFRSVAAAVAFFGLGGLTALYYELPTPAALSAAAFAGFAALNAVAAVMKGFRKLKHDGTARLVNAVGTTGKVYLRVPGHKSGPGKVTLTVQNRTVECEAVTAATEIPTGANVRVVAVLGPSAVEVELV